VQWSDTIKGYIGVLKPVKPSPELMQRILSLIDLTRLQADDTEANVAAFLEKARTPLGLVAAVCLYPQFVRLAATEFAGTPIKVASVANFPEGAESLESVLIEIGQALQGGAHEIDVVFPYHRYLAGERQYAQTFVSSCKAACGEDTVLKVILETGALKDAALIADASYDVIAAGADFIKTSTGKIPEGATLEAVATMLLVVKHITPQVKRRVGVKVSGGVRNLQQAAHYVELADDIMGREWVRADTFRIGASQLVDDMLARI
jgi:deoxyribose-phosphate aldolase